MDQLLEALLTHGGLVQLAVFVVPGFIAWRTYQLRRPQGEQKAASAFVEILASSVFVYVLWYAHAWTAWPNTWPLALLFLAQVFVTPVVVALGYQTLLEFCSSRYWITSAHPRAWDYIFNHLAYGKERGFAQKGLFLVVTLKNGDQVGGVFGKPGFTSLWPYDRDLLLGQVWQLDKHGGPVKRVDSSLGLYVNGDTIETIELFDYALVLESTMSAPMPGQIAEDENVEQR